MAFLCPVRIKRSKKKKPIDSDSMSGPSLGRITGSASIETLVRVGIEKENGLTPEAKMVVLHDFTPCVDDELEVKRGQIVHVVYQDNDWVYVIAEENNKEGFMPHSYCAPFGSQMATLALNVRKKLPRGLGEGGGPPGTGQGPGKATSMNGLPNVGNVAATRLGFERQMQNRKQDDPVDSVGLSYSRGQHAQQQQQMASNVDQSRSNSLMSETSSSQQDVQAFFKESLGRYIVLYTYHAQDENDLSVERGQCVTVLNSDDPDWFWVARYDHTEGFVPAGFIYPLDAIQRQNGLTSHSRQHGVRPVSHPAAVQPPPLTTSVPPLGSAGGSSGPSSYNTGLPLRFPGPESGSISSSSGLSPGLGASMDNAPRYNGTEMVMLYDYKAQAPDDLSVRRGDWVYADLTNQTVDGWLWCYAPKASKYGFIPKAYARTPASTNL